MLLKSAFRVISYSAAHHSKLHLKSLFKANLCTTYSLRYFSSIETRPQTTNYVAFRDNTEAIAEFFDIALRIDTRVQELTPEIISRLKSLILQFYTWPELPVNGMAASMQIVQKLGIIDKEIFAAFLHRIERLDHSTYEKLDVQFFCSVMKLCEIYELELTPEQVQVFKKLFRYYLRQHWKVITLLLEGVPSNKKMLELIDDEVEIRLYSMLEYGRNSYGTFVFYELFFLTWKILKQKGSIANGAHARMLEIVDLRLTWYIDRFHSRVLETLIDLLYEKPEYLEALSDSAIVRLSKSLHMKKEYLAPKVQSRLVRILSVKKVLTIEETELFFSYVREALDTREYKYLDIVQIADSLFFGRELDISERIIGRISELVVENKGNLLKGSLVENELILYMIIFDWAEKQGDNVSEGVKEAQSVIAESVARLIDDKSYGTSLKTLLLLYLLNRRLPNVDGKAETRGESLIAGFIKEMRKTDGGNLFIQKDSLLLLMWLMESIMSGKVSLFEQEEEAIKLIEMTIKKPGELQKIPVRSLYWFMRLLEEAHSTHTLSVAQLRSVFAEAKESFLDVMYPADLAAEASILSKQNVLYSQLMQFITEEGKNLIVKDGWDLNNILNFFHSLAHYRVSNLDDRMIELLNLLLKKVKSNFELDPHETKQKKRNVFLDSDDEDVYEEKKSSLGDTVELDDMIVSRDFTDSGEKIIKPSLEPSELSRLVQLQENLLKMNFGSRRMHEFFSSVYVVHFKQLTKKEIAQIAYHQAEVNVPNEALTKLFEETVLTDLADPKFSAADGVRIAWYLIVHLSTNQDVWNKVIDKIAQIKDLNRELSQELQEILYVTLFALKLELSYVDVSRLRHLLDGLEESWIDGKKWKADTRHGDMSKRLRKGLADMYYEIEFDQSVGIFHCDFVHKNNHVGLFYDEYAMLSHTDIILGKYAIKKRLLEALGMRVHLFTLIDWQKQKKGEERQQYVRKIMKGIPQNLERLRKEQEAQEFPY